ncbi:bifunctional glutamate N-acetyltransferase/amino-acid acetyltransferase ArgJ [Neorhodopirellula pilleata]|uniref:Arginine biosynthesis bifunctional protein ArgJ n=1 Tax=Neorhodopirellula pilleata TaxID=2714738 RepID=A0A5C6A934_9BACT|nr:bifunctional glutamate N-acetyltransferase/amino-acid acetyltransferase ArgJ [Neorhodopirellula pilleata]TWT96502.1 Arginine biosynthesis bifunctional protein ArgJ [Neorhodopirellula pilleata]
MTQPHTTETPFELPAGFRFAGATGGIKASGKPDVSLIVSDRPCVAAAVTTTNQVFAAPVTLCRERSPRATCRAVITNSGNANACTGKQGDADAREMGRLVAEQLGCDGEDVFVMSTGVIGHPMPMDKVRAGIESAFGQLGDRFEHFLAANDAICTTDAYRKNAAAEFSFDGKTYRIAAMCKGAGMIAPNMATMLGVVVTDFPLSDGQASTALKRIVERSFNRVSVDGHMSTNDTVILMSGGDAQSLASDEGMNVFVDAASEACLRLAKLIVADGEGAARFFEVEVTGAQSDDDALVIAKSVAASPLVKTAISGADPNWGRIVSAAGYAGPKIDVAHTSLTIEGTIVFESGQPVACDAAKLSNAMKAASEVKLSLAVGHGIGYGHYWSSDLTVDYVRFNALYTT